MANKSNKKNMIDNSQKEMSKRYENDLNATTKYLKDKFGKDIIIHHKMSYDYLARRIKAYSNYAKFVCERYGKKYEYIDIQGELSFISSMPYVTNLDILNNYFNISCAIAIYILDSINDCGHLSEAIKYIPSEKKLLKDINLPENFHYPLYSDELIKGVIFLIENRSKNISSASGYKDIFYIQSTVNGKQTIIDDSIRPETPSISKIQSMTFSQRLQCLISFIPVKVLSSAEKKFKNKIEECTELLLGEFNFIEKVKHARAENERQTTARKIFAVFRFFDKNNKGAFESLKFQREALRIENPYELCFAAFYLLEYQGSDYVWLIELCGLILQIACSMLPWYRRPDFSSQTVIKYQGVPVETWNYIYYSSWDYSVSDRLKDITLCRNFYMKEGYVLPQNNYFFRIIMFMNNESLNIEIGRWLCVLFVVLIFTVLSKFLSDFWSFLILAALIIMCYNSEISLPEVMIRKMLMKRIKKYPEIGFQQQNSEKNKEEYEKELAELRSTAAEQEKKLAELKVLAHDAEKKFENQRTQYDFLKSEYDLNLKELSELREAIYTIQNSMKLEDEIQRIKPEFPYHSKKKIVIAGGREQWLHFMEDCFPDAKLIYPSSLNFDTALIKNADIVWLETNNMPHALFYKISDTARSNGIQIKYFAFQSAKKCAIQIFLSESESTPS